MSFLERESCNMVTDETTFDAEMINECNTHKKHGIWCKFKTRIGLKKRKSKRFRGEARSHEDKAQLITSVSSESIPELSTDEYAYRSKKVDLAFVPSRYRLLEEVNYDLNATTDDSGFDDLSVGYTKEDQLSNDEDIFNKTAKGSTMKKFISKKWRGNKAKRVRKGIRHTSKGMWAYMQTSIQMQFLFPDASIVVSAAQPYRDNRS